MLELIQYRDAGMSTYTYFYIHEEKGVILSPYFDSEEDAKLWLQEQLRKLRLLSESQ